MIIRSIMLIMALIVLAACGSNSTPSDTASLPPGDAARGETLFHESVNSAPACETCHALTDEQKIGPSLAGYAGRAGLQVEDQSAEQYTHTSIVRPAAHLASGFANLMYADYSNRLTDQQISDLIAYLLTLE